MDFEETFGLFMKHWEIGVMIILTFFLLYWAFIATIFPSHENLNKGSEIIEKASIPFWLKPIEMVKNSENPLVAISIFVYFVLIVRYLKKKK